MNPNDQNVRIRTINFVLSWKFSNYLHCEKNPLISIETRTRIDNRRCFQPTIVIDEDEVIFRSTISKKSAHLHVPYVCCVTFDTSRTFHLTFVSKYRFFTEISTEIILFCCDWKISDRRKSYCVIADLERPRKKFAIRNSANRTSHFRQQAFNAEGTFFDISWMFYGVIFHFRTYFPEFLGFGDKTKLTNSTVKRAVMY